MPDPLVPQLSILRRQKAKFDGGFSEKRAVLRRWGTVTLERSSHGLRKSEGERFVHFLNAFRKLVASAKPTRSAI